MEPVSLSSLAQAGSIDRFVMEAVADTIAELHLNAQISDHVPETLGQTTQQIEAFLHQRAEAGCVRRCQGQLDLESIVLQGDQVLMLSSPEPGNDFQVMDVAEDLANLLIALEQKGLAMEASILLNRYFDGTGGVADDPATLLALRWFMGNQARREDGFPKLVAVGGLSGGGKSRMSRELAPLLDTFPGARVVRTDVVRKRMMGVGLSARLASHGYTPEKDQQTYNRFYDELTQVVEQGHSVIADGVFAKQEQRDGVEAVARRLGIPFIGLWVNAPPEIRAARVKARKNNVSDVTEAVIQRQLDYELGEIAWQEVDSTGPKQQTLARGREIIGI